MADKHSRPQAYRLCEPTESVIEPPVSISAEPSGRPEGRANSGANDKATPGALDGRIAGWIWLAELEPGWAKLRAAIVDEHFVIFDLIA